MIHSRKPHQYQIVQKILTETNNPTLWTEQQLNNDLKGEVVIGYIFKYLTNKFDTITPVLNLYTINSKHLQNQNKIITLDTLQKVFKEWVECETTRKLMFKNPPIKEWMDTKDNWVKKLANKLSVRYNRPYDECLSSVNMSIMKCYSKGHVYMGNLAYIENAADNDIKMEHRYEHRLKRDSNITVSMDETIGMSDDDTDITLHDLIGKVDPQYEEADFEVLKEDILNDLRDVFSEREIDQILNASGYLTMTIYRKLLKWRKTHKPEDYRYE